MNPEQKAKSMLKRAGGKKESVVFACNEIIDLLETKLHKPEYTSFYTVGSDDIYDGYELAGLYKAVKKEVRLLEGKRGVR